MPLSPAQFSSDEPVGFGLDFAQFGDHYFAGDRLYFEVGKSICLQKTLAMHELSNTHIQASIRTLRFRADS